ncbi:hypothetical protein GCM10007170_26730 [Arthrobacter liuii]|uniref:Secreted protein n=1 Tax=Arthrobacter liuii TaxID=1476996 RepID=A0ABQ2AVX8_9MICC|nr:hypothetical protein GCM10007170_26730 [Arthrobacter liuii]
MTTANAAAGTATLLRIRMFLTVFLPMGFSLPSTKKWREWYMHTRVDAGVFPDGMRNQIGPKSGRSPRMLPALWSDLTVA